MYKVFVNDKPIYFSDRALEHSVYEVYLYKNTRFEEIIHKLQHTQTNGIYLYHSDLEYLWNNFIQFFKIVEAAGGLVLNANDEMLFIYRNDHWDLPKGRMEQGETITETALREVEEECCITHLKIEKELFITYHIYNENGYFKLKKTHWFLMRTDDKTTPKPQREEGITKAVYIAPKEIEKYYPQMYANIKDLVINYLN